VVGEAPRPADPGLVAVAGTAPGAMGAGAPLEGWSMMGGWFWPVVVIVALLWALSIRAMLRRLLVRFDWLIRSIQALEATLKAMLAETPKGNRQ